jgi:ParB-like chromosome segregation protein Spo0J
VKKTTKPKTPKPAKAAKPAKKAPPTPPAKKAKPAAQADLESGAPSPGAGTIVPLDYARTYHKAFNLSLLAEDPKNARQEYRAEDDAALDESVRDKGVQTPLWIRPLDKALKTGETHVLLAGSRRLRSAKRVGLLLVPVFEYTGLDDAQAAELADLENCQRADLSDAERALHYAKMVAEHGWEWWNEADPARSLGHRFNLGGKSSSYEWARIARLPKLALEALASGDLRSRSVAVKLASIGDPKQLMEALQRAISNHWTDKEAAKIVAEEYLAELKGVPFDQADATLLPEAGSCEQCPFRSGNQKDLAPEFRRRGDICTKPACLQNKLYAAFQRQAKAHAEAGGVVWSGREAKENGLGEGWTNLSSKYLDLHSSGWIYQIRKQLEKGQTLKQWLKKGGVEFPAVILAYAPDECVTMEIVLTDEVVREATKAGLVKKESTHSGGGGGGDYAKQAAETRKRKVRGLKLLNLQIGKAVEMAEERPALDRAWALSVEPGNFLNVTLGHLFGKLSHDEARWISQRRALPEKDFALKDNRPDHMGLIQKAIAAAVTDAERLGWMTELMLWPRYMGDAKPEELDDRTEPLLEWLGTTGKEILKWAKAELAAVEVRAPLLKQWMPAMRRIYSVFNISKLEWTAKSVLKSSNSSVPPELIEELCDAVTAEVRKREGGGK